MSLSWRRAVSFVAGDPAPWHRTSSMQQERMSGAGADGFPDMGTHHPMARGRAMKSTVEYSVRTARGVSAGLLPAAGVFAPGLWGHRSCGLNAGCRKVPDGTGGDCCTSWAQEGRRVVDAHGVASRAFGWPGARTFTQGLAGFDGEPAGRRPVISTSNRRVHRNRCAASRCCACQPIAIGDHLYRVVRSEPMGGCRCIGGGY